MSNCCYISNRCCNKQKYTGDSGSGILEDSGILLLDGITETVKHEVKEQKGGFLSMLLGTLGASLLGDLLTKSL